MQRKTIPNERVDYLGGHCTSTSKVLELGCGAGHLAAKLQDKGLNILVSDISQVALDIAKSYYPSLDLQVVDARNLPYKDGSFNAVISTETVEHLPGVHQHFNEVWRILNTGGFYCFTMPNKWLDIIYPRLQPKKSKRILMYP